MQSFREIIAAWPTRREMAEELGVSVARVHKWHEREQIPGEMDVRLVPALKRRGVRVSYEDIARLLAEQPSPKDGAPVQGARL